MSLMQKYADIYGISVQEVKSWINDYAKGNVPESVQCWMEETKEERIESIKEYIQRMVDESLTTKIKLKAIEEGKICSSGVSSVVT